MDTEETGVPDTDDPIPGTSCGMFRANDIPEDESDEICFGLMKAQVSRSKVTCPESWCGCCSPECTEHAVTVFAFTANI